MRIRSIGNADVKGEILTQCDHLVNVLLVEDNPGDVRLIREAFKEGKFLNTLNVVPDGIEALSYLRREGVYADAARPDLIVLDLNLPRMGGLELLSTLKSDESLKVIPVVILTSSEAEEDIIASYRNYASCYISKPVQLSTFMDVVQSIEGFWLGIVKLP